MHPLKTVFARKDIHFYPNSKDVMPYILLKSLSGKDFEYILAVSKTFVILYFPVNSTAFSFISGYQDSIVLRVQPY